MSCLVDPRNGRSRLSRAPPGSQLVVSNGSDGSSHPPSRETAQAALECASVAHATSEAAPTRPAAPSSPSQVRPPRRRSVRIFPHDTNTNEVVPAAPRVPASFNRRRTISAGIAHVMKAEQAEVVAALQAEEVERRVKEAVDARFEEERTRRLYAFSKSTQCDAGEIAATWHSTQPTQTTLGLVEVELSIERLYTVEFEKQQLEKKVEELEQSLEESKRNVIKLMARQVRLSTQLKAASQEVVAQGAAPPSAANSDNGENHEPHFAMQRERQDLGTRQKPLAVAELAVHIADLRKEWRAIKGGVLEALQEGRHAITSGIVVPHVASIVPPVDMSRIAKQLNGMRGELDSVRRFVRESVYAFQSDVAQQLAAFVADPSRRERELVREIHRVVVGLALDLGVASDQALGRAEEKKHSLGPDEGMPKGNAQRHKRGEFGHLRPAMQTDQNATLAPLSWRSEPTLLDAAPHFLRSLRAVSEAAAGRAAASSIAGVRDQAVSARVERLHALQAAMSVAAADVSDLFSSLLGSHATMLRTTADVEHVCPRSYDDRDALLSFDRMRDDLRKLVRVVATNVHMVAVRGLQLSNAWRRSAELPRERSPPEPLSLAVLPAQERQSEGESSPLVAQVTLASDWRSQLAWADEINSRVSIDEKEQAMLVGEARTAHERAAGPASRMLTVQVDRSSLLDDLSRRATVVEARLAITRRRHLLSTFRAAGWRAIFARRSQRVCRDASILARTLHRIERIILQEQHQLQQRTSPATAAAATQPTMMMQPPRQQQPLDFGGDPASNVPVAAPPHDGSSAEQELRALLRRRLGGSCAPHRGASASASASTSTSSAGGGGGGGQGATARRSPRRLLMELCTAPRTAAVNASAPPPTPTTGGKRHQKAAGGAGATLGVPPTSQGDAHKCGGEGRKIGFGVGNAAPPTPRALLTNVPIEDVLSVFFSTTRT